MFCNTERKVTKLNDMCVYLNLRGHRRGLAYRMDMERRYKRDTFCQMPKALSDIKKAMKKRGYYTPKVKGERHRVLNADWLWNMT